MVTQSLEADRDAQALVRELVLSLHGLRHVDLDVIGAPLGLDIPAQYPDGLPAEPDSTSLSKAQRLDQAFASLSPDDYETVCARFLQRDQLSADLRNRVEDFLWSRERWPTITTRTRREIAAALDTVDAIWLDADGLLDLVRRHWVLPSPLAFFDLRDPYEPVIRHVIRNPGDWTTVQFFKEIGALSGGDRRFALFLEGLLSGVVNPNEGRQRQLVEAVHPVLAQTGLQVVEAGTTDGYPEFKIVPVGTRLRPAQLILFASLNHKPEMRVRDVLDQSLEVLTADDDVLAYDVPVGEAGLTWQDLEEWWSRRHSVSAEQSKRDLWQRLAKACDVSQAQRRLFDAYYHYAKAQDPLYALLPEVWVHWDPVSRAQRREKAYLTQRMDFLMLLPGMRRIVLEVDGQQHYTDSAGKPCPRTYSQTTRGDRDLRLSGYEVYRFGAYELSAEQAPSTVTEFFGRLLDR